MPLFGQIGDRDDGEDRRILLRQTQLPAGRGFKLHAAGRDRVQLDQVPGEFCPWHHTEGVDQPFRLVADHGGQFGTLRVGIEQLQIDEFV